MAIIAAVSDLHYHQYNNGLTLDDVIRVGDEFIELCKSTQADMVIFGGDTTLSRNPTYEVELAIIDFLKKLSKLNVPVAFLVGNHDRVYKSNFKIHSLAHVKLYPNDYPNITIMDQRQVYLFETRYHDIAIHAVPAGHKPENFDLYHDIANICVFHDIVMGSAMASGMPAETGLSVSLFDKKGFDLVLAGDNHHRQELKGLTDCQGIYLGAGLQHNWGDSGDVRGFTVIDSLPGVIQLKFIPSHSPKFIKVSWDITSIEQLIEHIKQINNWEGNIIKLNISGPNKLILDLDVEIWKNKISEYSKAKLLDMKCNYMDDRPNCVVEPKNDGEEWVTFLGTKVNNLENIDIEYLKKLGLEYISAI
jgi:DNA repair exonuclease SbcCD nuclease subunit